MPTLAPMISAVSLLALTLLTASCKTAPKTTDVPAELPTFEFETLRQTDLGSLIKLLSSPAVVDFKKPPTPTGEPQADTAVFFSGPLKGSLKSSFVAEIELLHRSAIREFQQLSQFAGASKFELTSAELDLVTTKSELDRVIRGDYWVVPTAAAWNGDQELSRRVITELDGIPGLLLSLMSPIVTSENKSVTPIFAFDVSREDQIGRLFHLLQKLLRDR